MIVDGKVPAPSGVGQLFAHGLTELHIDMSDRPFAKCPVGEGVCQLETELCLVGNSESVSKIGGIAGVVIVVAVVSQKCTDTGSLVVKGCHAEGTTWLDETLLTGRVDQVLDGVGEVDVGHRVERKQGVKPDRITDFTFLRVLLGDDLISDIAPKITVIPKHALGHGCP